MNDISKALSVATLLAAGLTAGCAEMPGPRDADVRPTPRANPAPQQNPRPPVTPPQADQPAAARFESLLKAAGAKVAAARDMRCRLVRREMVGQTLQPVEELDFRQRFSPHSLRLKWVGKRFKDRELIYVAGRNDNQVLVKVESGGLSGWLARGRVMSFALDSADIKNGSRYSPDVAGYNNLLKRLSRIFAEARAAKLAWVAQSPVETTDRGRAQKFEVTLEPALLDGDVLRMIVWFDLATSLPTHAILHDAKDRLVEDYDWRDLKLNVGLTDSDFTFETARPEPSARP
jgi:hypothetical protein